MKNIPVFTTEHGVASLTLREIPFSASAYIKLQATQDPSALLEECVSFCIACGAEAVFASGHAVAEQYPFHTAIVEMQCLVDTLPKTDACLFPVLPETAAKWRHLHNERMKDVPNTTFLTALDEKNLVEAGDGYFVHKDGTLLGIGRASADTIDLVISLQPGAGADIVSALASVLTTDAARLTVASTNSRAVRLYEKLGFLAIRELSRWYRIR